MLAWKVIKLYYHVVKQKIQPNVYMTVLKIPAKPVFFLMSTLKVCKRMYLKLAKGL